MEWSEGGKWDNCNSIINKYFIKKRRRRSCKKKWRSFPSYQPHSVTLHTATRVVLRVPYALHAKPATLRRDQNA